MAAYLPLTSFWCAPPTFASSATHVFYCPQRPVPSPQGPAPSAAAAATGAWLRSLFARGAVAGSARPAAVAASAASTPAAAAPQPRSYAAAAAAAVASSPVAGPRTATGEAAPGVLSLYAALLPPAAAAAGLTRGETPPLFLVVRDVSSGGNPGDFGAVPSRRGGVSEEEAEGAQAVLFHVREGADLRSERAALSAVVSALPRNCKAALLVFSTSSSSAAAQSTSLSAAAGGSASPFKEHSKALEQRLALPKLAASCGGRVGEWRVVVSAAPSPGNPAARRALAAAVQWLAMASPPQPHLRPTHLRDVAAAAAAPLDSALDRLQSQLSASPSLSAAAAGFPAAASLSAFNAALETAAAEVRSAYSAVAAGAWPPPEVLASAAAAAALPPRGWNARGEGVALSEALLGLRLPPWPVAASGAAGGRFSGVLAEVVRMASPGIQAAAARAQAAALLSEAARGVIASPFSVAANDGGISAAAGGDCPAAVAAAALRLLVQRRIGALSAGEGFGGARPIIAFLPGGLVERLASQAPPALHVGSAAGSAAAAAAATPLPRGWFHSATHPQPYPPTAQQQQQQEGDNTGGGDAAPGSLRKLAAQAAADEAAARAAAASAASFASSGGAKRKLDAAAAAAAEGEWARGRDGMPRANLAALHFSPSRVGGSGVSGDAGASPLRDAYGYPQSGDADTDTTAGPAPVPASEAAGLLGAAAAEAEKEAREAARFELWLASIAGGGAAGFAAAAATAPPPPQSCRAASALSPVRNGGGDGASAAAGSAENDDPLLAALRSAMEAEAAQGDRLAVALHSALHGA